MRHGRDHARGVLRFWAVMISCLAGVLTAPSLVAGVPSFRLEVLPILTKAGCNAGGCHGAATGQGGFKLSLLGYDPEADYDTLTHEAGARRIDLDHPTSSLILRKATDDLDHEGGRRFAWNSPFYQTLLAWIERGAGFGESKLSVQALSVSPSELLLDSTNSVQVQVVATLSDGATRPATELSLFDSNDESVATVTKAGLVQPQGPGLSSIMVRCHGQVACVRVIVPYPPRTISHANFVPRNLIDQEVLKEWKRLNLSAADPAGNGEFLRRVTLDLTGRLPALETARQFLSQPDSTDTRSQVVEDLIRSEAFTDFWTMRLADLLLVNGKRSGDAGARKFYDWLHAQVQANEPLDRMVAQVISAKGDLKECGPANFYTVATDPRDLGEQVSRIFLGVQLACARCHSHPTDRWTQADYYQFASYFSGVNRAGDAISFKARPGLDHPKSGRALRAKPPGGPVSKLFEEDPRPELAEWITHGDGSLFSRAVVNRVWKHLFGRGLVEPVDDLRPTNPAIYPAVLDHLAQHFVGHAYDLRDLVRVITTSRTYQATSGSAPGQVAEERLFTHYPTKPLEAPVLLDAIAQVTGVAEDFDGYPSGTRAVQLVDARPGSYALDVLGRCQREKPCESDRGAGGGLAQALHLINGRTINQRLSSGLIVRLRESTDDQVAIIHECYLRAYARPPSSDELREWTRFLGSASNRTEALQDLIWVLLNSREFALNH